ncbi:MAG: hypothetical protein AUH86_17700 [Acidobacteria bacterium 13_1_40CM_4_58_4]|nr:MAG: hypothetical protein AUH86_17700 [Acidobacteria bacterium 13_1_40CM_4_58_4]HLB88924.1 hypothetical protein [Terriglobales bacterium]
MAKKKRLEDDAEQVAIYLTPTEKLVMDVIAGRRKKRQEERTSPSEIVADGLWKILTESEGILKEKIQELLAVHSEKGQEPDNLKIFPKN